MALDLLAVANKLVAEAKQTQNVRSARLGVGPAYSMGVAAEVIAVDYTIRTLAAQSDDQLENASYRVIFLEPLYNSADTTESVVMQASQDFVTRLTIGTFDHTLGGLVEDTQPIGGNFGVIERDSHEFRFGTVDVFAGELDGSI